MTTKRTRPASSGAAPPFPTASEDRPMPGTTLRHPPIGLGLWALGRWTREDEARTRATIDRAIELGIRWFDTAAVYGAGRSERLLGDALARRPAGAPPVFLTTKLPVDHLRPAEVRPSLIGSLERLGVPKVDLYLVHGPDPSVPIRDTMGALEAVWKEGRVGAIGVSNFSAEEVREARAALHEAPLVVNQVRGNLLEPEELDALAAVPAEERLFLEAYTPLARGLLAGRYLTGEGPDAHVRSFARDLFARDQFPVYRKRARELQALADRHGVPLTALALHGLARRGIAPVFGASRPEQVDAVWAAWGIRPAAAVLDEAEALGRGTRA